MPIGSAGLRELVEKLVTDRGFDLEDAVVRTRDGQEEFSIVVDRDGGSDLDVLAELSNEIGEVLDAAPDLADTPFTLEVTSPGVDRPLTLPRHWRRARGRKVVVDSGSDGGKATIAGRVGPITDDQVSIVVNRKGRLDVATVDLNSITKAVVQVDFSRPSVAELEMCGLDTAEIEARVRAADK
ncbi:MULTISPECIES: ribosome maturation factor RimP [unclassified Gordonia (in: high G+C Gram-positive bacteria)]|uniref:ribosome maturation factor RimP n=1 Tax=unclassified Gordonia (in: high G+C Gram-positive bacteria) TaxID=2657482 RepID=UPI001F0D4F48|nr:ribosome maturation factor RimP [Gordonia sp. ABSL49_1]MCH5642422.1 ribosome maturation factor RimP [Gordonia sp. ABSL49_1]